MLAVAEAVAKVVSGFTRLPAEQVGIADAAGRVLAEDVAARTTQPPADVSAMDGYAVRATDVPTVPVTLRRIGESAAGAGFAGTVGTGEAARIFTGAPVPTGADAIVIQEDTETDGETVVIREVPTPGRWIRRAGLDFAAGDVLLRAGQVLSPRHIGLAAAMNVPWLMVRRRPRVAIVATGNEVVMPGDPLGPDQIVSSNSLAVAATVTALGGTPQNLGIARDDADSLRQLVEGASGADLLVTIGGASVGDYDLVGQVLGDKGLDLGFYKVAMRPGKPLIFGSLGETAVLGLPGNPVSVGVTSLVFLKPAMQVMLGIDEDEALATALLGRDLAANDQRQDYLRAKLSRNGDGSTVATPFEAQDSSILALFAAADCLVVRAPHAPPVKAGERVDVLTL